MVTLLLDTSTERGFLALVKEAKILVVKAFPFGLKSSAYLLPLLQEALLEGGLNLSDLQKIAVGLGPGSYTGIRVAASFARGLSLAKKIPLCGFCALLGWVPPCGDGKVLSVIDAKVGGAYVALQERKGQELSVIVPPKRAPFSEVRALAATAVCVCAPVKEKCEKMAPHPRWLEREVCIEALLPHLATGFSKEISPCYLSVPSYLEAGTLSFTKVTH